MRYDLSPAFVADYKKLAQTEKDLFKAAALEFAAACDAYVASNTSFPGALRVKPVQGATGVFEMTWSLSVPDGRATWQWDSIEVNDTDGTITTRTSVLWRRIGLHAILAKP